MSCCEAAATASAIVDFVLSVLTVWPSEESFGHNRAPPPLERARGRSMVLAT